MDRIPPEECGREHSIRRRTRVRIGYKEQLMTPSLAQEHSQNGSALVPNPVSPTKNTLDSPAFESSSNETQKRAEMFLPVSLYILN